MRLFDYLQHCSIEDFVEWLFEWSDQCEENVIEQIEKSLAEQGQHITKLQLSPELRKSIILQGLESEIHDT